MSAFQFAIESADNAEFNEAPLANGEETHTVANAIAEAQDLAQEAADEDQVADKLEDEQEQAEDLAEEVEDTVAQEGALDATSARLLKVALSNIVGKAHAKKTLPATESYSGGRQAGREATRIALEGIKETLKQFWEAIKAQFKKVYQKVKDWMVKTFSAAKKLKERAEALQNKASSTVGSIEDKSFSFGQTKTIAVDGKYNDPNTVTSGLHDIRNWIVGNLTVQKSEQYENAVESASTAIEKAVKDIADDLKSGGGSAKSHAQLGDAAMTKALKDLGSIGISPLGTISNIEPKQLEMYGGGKGSTDKVAQSKSLPGGKALIAVIPDFTHAVDADGVLEWTKHIKNTRVVLGNDKYNPRDVTEGDVKTLTTSQIDKVCDDVIEIAEISYTYEKAWERRDKFQSKLEREVDQIVKEVDQEDHDKVDSTVQRAVRQYAEAFTASVRRRTTFESQFISYALNTASAMLNYSERSLAQHKSK